MLATLLIIIHDCSECRKVVKSHVTETPSKGNVCLTFTHATIRTWKTIEFAVSIVIAQGLYVNHCTKELSVIHVAYLRDRYCFEGYRVQNLICTNSIAARPTQPCGLRWTDTARPCVRPPVRPSIQPPLHVIQTTLHFDCVGQF